MSNISEQGLVEFARKLMRVRDEKKVVSEPAAILGSAVSLPSAIVSTKPYRIGLWPCVSEEDPKLAMGLFATLAHLLEHWQDTVVYRLFVRLEGNSDEFQWSMQQSQFGIDDWTVDALDENIAIWGQLTKPEDWQLTIYIENDYLMGDDDEPKEFIITASDEAGLIEQLPHLAEQIAAFNGANRLDESEPIYDITRLSNANIDNLRDLMEQLLLWDAQLITMLWGLSWDDDDILEDFETLLAKGVAVESDFAAWAVAKALTHTFLPGYRIVGQLLLKKVANVLTSFEDYASPDAIIAGSLYQLGQSAQAFDILTKATQKNPTVVYNWLKLANIRIASSHTNAAVDTLQNAIQQITDSAVLYRRYGDTLVIADQEGDEIDNIILSDDGSEDWLLWEAVEAYQRAIDTNPDDFTALYNQLIQLAQIDSNHERFWEQFKALVAGDVSNNYVRDVIDSLYYVDDISDGTDAIQASMQKNGESFGAYINLASLHLVYDEGDEAYPYLEKAKQLAESVEDHAEVERLMLNANYPEFEFTFAEISAVVGAGNSARSEDVEFLEEIAKSAPHVLEIHLLLARAYKAWDDLDAALDVLLDTNERIPNNPVVLDLLADVLWTIDQKELAFQYLNQGIQQNPFNVPLLVRIGRYLFDNGQLDQARMFLARAEEIAPRSGVLQSTRTYIASKMSENPDLYRKSKD